MAKIGEITTEKKARGGLKLVRVQFGPHYFVEITEGKGDVTFVVGATHHGFKADASHVNGELEKLINEFAKDILRMQWIDASRGKEGKSDTQFAKCCFHCALV
jgi:hypothetical protein